MDETDAAPSRQHTYTVSPDHIYTAQSRSLELHHVDEEKPNHPYKDMGDSFVVHADESHIDGGHANNGYHVDNLHADGYHEIQETSLPSQEAEPPSAGSNVPGSFTILDALFLIGGMVMYIVDIIMDVLVAVQYFHDDRILWSGMTMAFIIIPSITLQYFSLRWFYADSVEEANTLKKSGTGTGNLQKICTVMTWLVTHTLQLGAINRYWRTLKFGWRSRSGETALEDYNHMVCEYRDTTMLRLLEAFMESAPQLVLQLYIMTQLTDIYWLTAASALSSLASLSWSLEAYHKALREAYESVENIGWLGLGFRMSARTFLITSRVISLALFAAHFEWWIFVVAGAHWLLMTLWLIYLKTDFCGTSETRSCEEVMFDGIIGIVYIFCFFNMKPGRTRYRALGYYTLVFAENTVIRDCLLKLHEEL